MQTILRVLHVDPVLFVSSCGTDVPHVSSCGTDVPVVFEMMRFAASAAAGAATYLRLGYGCKRRRLLCWVSTPSFFY